MKKFVNILFATAVAALAMVSCQKKEISNPVENVEPVVNETAVVNFYAKDIETKTVFGELSGSSYPTLWTSDQKVRISQNEAASIEGTVVPVGTGASADFTLASPMTDDGSGNYIFYAMSPSAAQVSDLSSEYHSWSVEIPASQTPSASSPDQAAQILFASYDAGASFPESVGLSFSHLTAYGKLSFTNLGLDAGETVTSVVIEAESNFVGRYRYYYADHTPNVAGDFVGYANLSSILTLITSSTSDIWFACAPAEVAGEELVITVNTTLGSFSKTITVPSTKNFEAGKVASMTLNMSGISRTTATVYTLVKDVDDLTIGSEVILVERTNSKAAGLLSSNTYLSSQDVTIGEGDVAGTYAFTLGSTGEYFSWKTSTNMESNATLSAAGSWGITIDASGDATIRNMSATTRYLRFNSGSPRFTAYVLPNDDYLVVSIYKNLATGSGSITPKEPTSIAISGVTTSYSVDDAYSFDGIVTLTYSDLSTEELSPSAYTVDDSGVDMTAAGSYTITVSLNADPSITASYNISVTGGGGTDYSITNTSNVTLTTSGGTSASTAKVKIGGEDYDAIKAGTGSKAGAVKVTVPSGTTKLHLHVAAWNGETVTLGVTPTANVSKINNAVTTSMSLTADSGVSGSGTTYTLNAPANVNTSYYFTIDLTGISGDTALTFTATSGKRFVIWGVNAE